MQCAQEEQDSDVSNKVSSLAHSFARTIELTRIQSSNAGCVTERIVGQELMVTCTSSSSWILQYLSRAPGPRTVPWQVTRTRSIGLLDDDDCTVACVGKEHITVALGPGAAESRMAEDA